MTRVRRRAVRMFFATPRLRWKSPKRRLPSKASRTISRDHQSPIASTDRATGHSLSSNRVLVTMVSLSHSGCNMLPTWLPSPLVAR